MAFNPSPTLGFALWMGHDQVTLSTAEISAEGSGPDIAVQLGQGRFQSMTARYDTANPAVNPGVLGLYLSGAMILWQLGDGAQNEGQNIYTLPVVYSGELCITGGLPNVTNFSTNESAFHVATTGRNIAFD